MLKYPTGRDTGERDKEEATHVSVPPAPLVPQLQRSHERMLLLRVDSVGLLVLRVDSV